MSNLVGSALFGSSASNSMTDQLVDAYKQSQQSKVDTLTQKKTDLESKRTFYNSLFSKINSLSGAIDKFGELKSVEGSTTFVKNADTDANFFAKTISTSDSSILSASSDSESLIGINQIKVNRLATSDILISNRMTLADNFSLVGDHTFNLSTGDGKSYGITVSLGDTPLTNEAALKKIVNAINTQITKATEDSDTTEGISAAYVKDTTSTGRITLTSKNTGESYKVSFSDDSTGLLAAIGLDDTVRNARTASADAAAGYKVSDSANLNSQIEINGITVTRDSNTVEDALTGVTLNLLKTQTDEEQPVTLNTSVDSKAVQSYIQSFIDSYNGLYTYLGQNKTTIRNETTVSSLQSRLRFLASEAVPRATDQSSLAPEYRDPQYLSEIGITTNKDGTLAISDTTKLTNMLKDDPQKVSHLFTSENGFASKVISAIENLSDNNGIIKTRQTSLNSQIQTAAKRITDAQDRIDRQAETLRKEYESMLKVYLDAQSQYQLLSTNYSTATG